MAVSQVPRSLKIKIAAAASTAAKAGQRIWRPNSLPLDSRQCAMPPGTMRKTTGTIKGTNTALKYGAPTESLPKLRASMISG